MDCIYLLSTFAKINSGPMKHKLLALFVAFSAFQIISAQIIKPVKWTYSSREVDASHTELIFKATITSPWHMYGLNIPEGGPIPVSISFENEQGFVSVGKPTQSPKPELVDDKIFKMQLELHSGQVSFSQRIRKTTKDSITIKGVVEYMTCSDVQCIPGDEEFEIKLNGLKPTIGGTAESSDTPQTQTPDAISDEDSSSVEKDTMLVTQTGLTDPEGNKSSGSPRKSLWGVFFLAMVAGLGGLLTPCVYPMIPMTVSYFLRNDKPRSRAISEAIVFGLSMVLLYTLIGVLVAIFKNPNAVNDFTTHWITNLVFFSIFIVLAASFFGMFEIMLPSGLANSVDKQADKGGYLGAFFMAVAMAVLSFSCTGPIVASLLIKASQGEVLEPVIGMAGFSIVFALPFTLFAIFPSWLQGLPKSGAWLNGIKVFFAFIMLAFSLYFLSKIDQSYHLNLISRSIFISIWVVTFTLMGLYFLGKIKFAHDSPVSHLSVPRLLLTIISFSFALYLFTGLLGNDLKGLSTILPASESKTGKALIENSANNDHALCSKPKYSDFLSLPNGINGYFDYNEALACAKEQNKPVLVDFVGHTCSNCKKMYAEVWSDPRVIKLLNDKFIVVALYTDDKTKLPKEEWIESSDGKVKSTIGKKNQELQVTRFNSNALPLYAIVDGEGKDLSSTYYTYDPDIQKFLDWLEGSNN
jgi:thiol:disulfide interchange protein DsbD